MYMLVRWRSGVPRPAELKTRDFERLPSVTEMWVVPLARFWDMSPGLGDAMDGESYIGAGAGAYGLSQLVGRGG